MLIKGLQKVTLLDYPGQVACTIFTGGCNMRCPFCQNAFRSEKYKENGRYPDSCFLRRAPGRPKNAGVGPVCGLAVYS